MELKDGLYEQVINKFVADNIVELRDKGKMIMKNQMDNEESYSILSQYLAQVIAKGLSYIHKENKLERQIKISNKIIEFLKTETCEESISEFFIEDNAEMLLAILDKVNSKYAVLGEKDVIRPITPLAQSSLFTGSILEPSLVSELKKEILSSDRIDMLVSFIKWSGLRLIADEIVEFTKKNKLRIITTSYMGATDYKAIEFLAKLPNTEVKISYDTKRTRLHAKAYAFHRDTGFGTAYIGSCNLSNVAISSGLEWNMKVTEQDSRDILKKFEATFESYWHDKEFIHFKIEDSDVLRRALSNERAYVQDDKNFIFDIQPYSFQKEILEKLEAERNVHGKYRNLVVAATGTGKTVISAFDYKRFCNNNPGKKNRLLFIAHRKEILEQSLSCFKGILRDQNFGDLLVGNHKPEQIEHLFMSIQSFNAKDFKTLTTPDYYDFIIVDEFHHAAAPSYQSLLEYYTPKILLGLTATPERMDNKDILECFDGRIAAEIRLGEAIDRKLLSPFQYFGVSDNVDLTSLTWSKGGYDIEELQNVYTHNTRRSQLIIESLNRYVDDINNVIGLGFCVSVKHAMYMADFFNQNNIPSRALHGNSTQDERSNVQELLRRKEIKFIFVVDLYNEGIDIPEVNTVMFLRPTESMTVFLQQLGRGLRISESKDCLTVLDFIGQAHKKYNFEDKFRALIGKTHHSIQRQIKMGFPNMPRGCYIKLEKMSQKYILDSIKNSLNNKVNLVRKIASFTDDTGKELTLKKFVFHYNININELYSRACWNRLCVEAGKRENFNNPDEQRLTKALLRIQNINSRRWINYLLKTLRNIDNFNENNINEDEKKMLLMLHYTIWQEPLKSLGFNNIKESLLRLRNNSEIYNELIEILEINFEKIDFIDEDIELGFSCPLDLHCKYSRDEILTAVGYYTIDKKPSQREGVLYMPEHDVDLLFVTLNKSEKDYSPTTLYDDYAIDEMLFHWQSQSTTSVTSNTGQRYLNHRKLNSKVLLFVREYKQENGITSPYYYLGPVNYISHTGNRPISIVWELEYKMPTFIVKKSNKMIVG